MNNPLIWKENWEESREHHLAWWRREGLIVNPANAAFYPRRPSPRCPGEEPAPPESLAARYTDPKFVAARMHHRMANASCPLDALPIARVDLGPGSLAVYLGSTPKFSETTVWFEPCIEDPDTCDRIALDSSNPWWRRQLDLVESVRERAQGLYWVGCPDLVENLDILASLRDTQLLMIDLIERPEWVRARLREITEAYFTVFDAIYPRIRDPEGGMAFGAFALWGLGKTAKVQCDTAAMISRDMFDEFVVPGLRRQCAWLDNSMFHLDGTQAIQHLDSLLAIPELDAVEYTAQAGIETGGHPRWWPLYRRVIEAGKAVQVMDVAPREVAPLLHALGTRGVYLHVPGIGSEAQVAELESIVAPFRA